MAMFMCLLQIKCSMAFAFTPSLGNERLWRRNQNNREIGGRSPFSFQPNGNGGTASSSTHLMFTPLELSFAEDLLIQPQLSSTISTMSTMLEHGSSLLLSHGIHYNLPTVTGNAILDRVIGSAVFWATTMMSSLVLLLKFWDDSVEFIEDNVYPGLKPVVNSILAELCGLGFIGLFLETFILAPNSLLGKPMEMASELFFDEHDFLLEDFEFLHQNFFIVAIGFFFVAGFKVFILSDKMLPTCLVERESCSIEMLDNPQTNLIFNSTVLTSSDIHIDDDGNSNNENGPNANNRNLLTKEQITTLVNNAPVRTIWEDIMMNKQEFTNEMLLIGRRFEATADETRRKPLPNDFSVGRYFEQIFASNLEQLVELTPIIWGPLIPLIALGAEINFSRGFISAQSSEHALAAGVFVSTWWFIIPNFLTQFTCVCWGVFNTWKMKKIKDMVVPILAENAGPNGESVILPPRYRVQSSNEFVNTSPGFTSSLERFIAGFLKGSDTTTMNKQEKLFGAAGSAGKDMYLNSIKLNSWINTALFVFSVGEILRNDVKTLIEYSQGSIPLEDIGNLAAVLPELVVHAAFAVGQLITIIFLAPNAFYNYCAATSVEELTQNWAIKKSLKVVRKMKIDDETDFDVDEEQEVEIELNIPI